jgi:uncharacterized damage-inducible protein DinB
MTTSNGAQEAARLERAVRAFVDRVQTVPEDRLRKPPAEGEWSVGELAAHSAEIYGYWAKQIDFLRANPGQPFGRTASDPDRIAFVEHHKNDALPSLVAAINASAAEAATSLRAYSDEQWRSTTGLHSVRGEMDMDYISNLFIAGHAEEHLNQLDETLAALEK